MLFTHFNNDRLMFVHRVDEKPDADDFPFHSHPCLELIYLISGNITFTVEGKVFRPKPRDIMVFNKTAIHKTNIENNSPYERVVIRIKEPIIPYLDKYDDLFYFYDNTDFSGIIAPKDFNDDYWERSLKRIIDIPNENLGKITAGLIPFLYEIKNTISSSSYISDSNGDDLLGKIISYITRNLTDDITPDNIADYFFISRSKLDKLFRNNNATSVCKYINLKRLHLAETKINRGEKPTKVFSECGFKDYTTFYRAYKSEFGVSPKVKTNKNENIS